MGQDLNSHFTRTTMHPCLGPVSMAAWDLWRGLLDNETEGSPLNKAEPGAAMDEHSSCAEAASNGDPFVYAALLFWSVAVLCMLCREFVLRPRAAKALERFGHAHSD